MLFENEYRPPSEPPAIPTFRRADNGDAVFQAALRALAPILTAEERQRWQAVIDSEPTIAQRFALWRAMRNEYQCQENTN